MGIPDEEQNFEIYYKMIEQAEDLTKYDSDEKIEELAEEVFQTVDGVLSGE